MNRVLPCLANDGNRQLIEKWLTEQTPYEAAPYREDDPFAAEFDLCIVDGPALGTHRAGLLAHKEDLRPEFKPALLLVPPEYSTHIDADIWEYVDDIIWTAVGDRHDSLDPFELDGRLQSLLRARSMSRTLEENRVRLKVLHRLLRHNIRNSINVIRGRAEMIDAPESSYIFDESNRLLRHTEKAQEIDELLEGPTDRRCDLVAEARMIRNRFETEHPGTAITVDAESAVEVLASHGISRAIEELVENAIVHDPAGDDPVEIRISERDGNGRLSVLDAAPAINEQDRRVLRGDHEPSALDHGSGLGLWLVVWTVKRSNGEIEYRERAGGGNCITLAMPLAS